jgi:g-D-glutamyl-meso-diaminopimelate peptidase
VFYNAAHHALEWITSPLLMKFIEDFSKAYALGQNIAGYVPSEIWDKSSIYIVPMVNPDGVNLVLNGLSPTNPYYNKLIQWNNGTDFSDQWQANIRGVDLNHNYNAGWEESKEAAIALGITGPGPTRYSGPYPLSEPETRAMVDFTRDRNFRLVLAYHSQGEVIFWNFQNMATQEAREIGEALAGASGYELDQPTGVASYAGFKDWFIKEYRRPGYTVEVGRGKNPLPISQFDQIYRDNLPLLLLASVI